MRLLYSAVAMMLALAGRPSQSPPLQPLDAFVRTLTAATSDDDRTRLAAANPQFATSALAETLRLEGVSWWEKGEFPRALPLLESAAAIARFTGETATLAKTLNNIGIVHGAQGNYGEALGFLQQSLALWEQLHDDGQIASVTLNIGSIFRWQRDFEQALAVQRRVLAAGQQRGDGRLTAAASINIAFIQLERGDVEDARKHFQLVIDLGGQIAAGPLATALDGMGDLLLGKNALPEAAGVYQRALDVHLSASDRAGAARSLGSLAWVRHEQGDYPEAVHTGNEALAIARELGLKEVIWRVAHSVGSSHLHRDEYGEARAAFEQSIAAIEQMRADLVGSEREQQRFFTDKMYPYHGMVALLVRQGRGAEALDYAERAKARVLLDVSRSGRIRVQQAMTADERSRESQLRDALARGTANVQRAAGSGRSGNPALVQAEAERDRARIDYGRFETELYVRHPELRVKRGEVEWPDAGSVAALLGSETAVLEYVVSEDECYGLLVRRSADGTTQVRSWLIAAGAAALRDRVVDLRRKLALRDLSFRRSAAELYDLLVRPAAGDIAGATNLVIVPDGVLWDLPFQALHDGRHYMIEQQAMVSAPSLTVLAAMRRVPLPSATAQRLFAVGNPINRTPSLPNAELEVQRIVALHGREGTRLLTGDNAVESVVKQEMPHYGIVHLATHGQRDDRDPLGSHVLLAAPRPGDTDDGVLEARELMELQLDTRLVVLSACETALGEINNGEGVIGLTWALFIAGNLTTVASQWQVDSESTTNLMIAFHRSVSRTPDALDSSAAIASALRRAALGLLRSPATAHPFYWAGFVTVGARL